MKKYQRLAEAHAPDGTRLELFRHDSEYVIRADGAELMSTRRHHSEELLSELACEQVRERPGACVLIGGLGLGFTLRAALRSLPADAKVVVAEIVPAVVVWNRNPEFQLASESLRDPRVEIREQDVAAVLDSSRDEFDAIMLDVDNGANALVTVDNSRLYQNAGIRSAVRAIRRDGCVAYWSADEDPAFERALRGAALTVRTVKARAHVTTGPWHILYLAHVARGTPPPIADAPA